jgi:hypothetical protein
MPQQSVARAETTAAAQDSKHDNLKQNFQKEHELGGASASIRPICRGRRRDQSSPIGH